MIMIQMGTKMKLNVRFPFRSIFFISRCCRSIGLPDKLLNQMITTASILPNGSVFVAIYHNFTVSTKIQNYIPSQGDNWKQYLAEEFNNAQQEAKKVKNKIKMQNNIKVF